MDYTILGYALFLVVIFVICFGGVFLKRKFKIKDSELELAKQIINGANYIASTTNFAYKGQLSEVVKLCILSINAVESYADFNTIEAKKSFIKEKALIMCNDYNIKTDHELNMIVDGLVDYFVK